jgi:hypothetical protein
MNEFSEFDVVDAIKVCDLAKIVRHRRIIAPVYAAPGIDVRAVKRETGFNIHWGPTHQNDLPDYIARGFKRTAKMYGVQFGFRDRLEQAVANAVAYAMTMAVGLLFWPAFVGRVIGLILVTYLLGFVCTPCFSAKCDGAGPESSWAYW